jgi:hypothetical protein
VRRWGFGLALAGIVTAPLGAARASEFAHPKKLLTHELSREPPHSIYVEAAFQLTEAGDLAAARDAWVGAVKRRESLGFPFDLRDLLLALQYDREVEADPAADQRLLRFLGCLLDGREEFVKVPLGDPFFAAPLPCRSPWLMSAAQRNYALAAALELAAHARGGQDVRTKVESAYRACSECTLAHVALAQAALASNAPELAVRVLGDEDRALFARLREVARYQILLQKSEKPDAIGASYFVAAAFRSSCLALRAKAPKSHLLDAACRLGGETSGDSDPRLSARLKSLRENALERIAYARETLASD